MGVEFNTIDHTDEVLKALETQLEAGLEAVGNNAVSHAKQNITAAGRIDTSKLINSVNHKVETGEKAVYIGTNTEYAIYNEMGTGIYASGGGGRQTPWVYQDAKGEWHRTRGMRPIHFLKNAAANFAGEYVAIIKQYLSK